MSEEIENKLNTIPVIKQLVAIGKTIKPTSLEGLSVYDILELYVKELFPIEPVRLLLVFLWLCFRLHYLF
jgi:hypothetical protein